MARVATVTGSAAPKMPAGSADAIELPMRDAYFSLSLGLATSAGENGSATASRLCVRVMKVVTEQLSASILSGEP